MRPTIILLSLLLLSCSGFQFPSNEFKKVEPYWMPDTKGINHPATSYIDPTYNPFNSSDALELWSKLHSRIEYKSDNYNEWQFPEDTYTRKQGDCEDQAVLLASALRAEGYDAWVAIGETWSISDTLHAWVVLIDGDKTYFFNETARPWFRVFGIDAYQTWWRVGWEVYYIFNEEEFYINTEIKHP